MCKRASLRNVDQLAVPTPGSVNRHHKNWNAAFELNAEGFSAQRTDHSISPSSGRSIVWTIDRCTTRYIGCSGPKSRPTSGYREQTSPKPEAEPQLREGVS
jgi:hypothetical protein